MIVHSMFIGHMVLEKMSKMSKPVFYSFHVEHCITTPTVVSFS